MMRTILVTGAAGFIGHHLSAALVRMGDRVVGVDSVTDYYDVSLKRHRLGLLGEGRGFEFHAMDVNDTDGLVALCRRTGVTLVVHLAAQAGVRYSIENPFAYQHANLAGHLSVLEACRGLPAVEHLVYASSSSVYGDRPESGDAFRESDRADKPVSLYAATKRSCEMMSESYSQVHGLRQSGLRFFTVYGPLGRPDMAYYSFTRRICAGEPIEVFGEGRMRRDFTYVDDAVSGILGLLGRTPDAGSHEVYNVGNRRPRELGDFISVIERLVGREAVKVMRPMQPGDVSETWADTSKLRERTGYEPRVSIEQGLSEFVDWYRGYHGAP